MKKAFALVIAIVGLGCSGPETTGAAANPEWLDRRNTYFVDGIPKESDSPASQWGVVWPLQLRTPQQNWDSIQLVYWPPDGRYYLKLDLEEKPAGGINVRRVQERLSPRAEIEISIRKKDATSCEAVLRFFRTGRTEEQDTEPFEQVILPIPVPASDLTGPFPEPVCYPLAGSVKVQRSR